MNDYRISYHAKIHSGLVERTLKTKSGVDGFVGSDKSMGNNSFSTCTTGAKNTTDLIKRWYSTAIMI